MTHYRNGPSAEPKIRGLFYLNEQQMERARQAAAADRRSLSNWFAVTIERALEEIPVDGDTP